MKPNLEDIGITQPLDGEEMLALISAARTVIGLYDSLTKDSAGDTEDKLIRALQRALAKLEAPMESMQ